ncbi:hypothetical protein [Tropicimonas aquimaris]|uniref:Mitochondrial inner membrane protein n=1 Tax=Tropicimonas aquimaris TaxID=914152 RepID=A0ABW3IWY9_9RHOB
MADKKKSETASNQIDPTDEKPVDEARISEDVAAEEAAESVETDAVEDAAEPVEETPDAEDLPEVDRVEPEEVAASDEIFDAEVLEDIAADEETAEPVESDPDFVDAATGTDAAPEDEVEPDSVSDQDVADLEALDGATPEQVEEASGERSRFTFEPDRIADEQPLPVTGKETIVVERRGGVLSGFLGGVIATLGLAFAAPFVIPQSMMPDFGTTALKEEIASLEGEVATLQGNLAEAAKQADLEATKAETGSELTALRETLSGVQSDIVTFGETRSSVQTLLDETAAITGRIDELEKRPIAEATDPASIAAVEAYGREVAQMREELQAMLSRSEEMVAQAAAAAEEAVQVATSESQEAIAAAEAEAAAAAERAERAARAQAMVDIQAALETGAPYAETLAELEGIEIPGALSAAAENGVSTLAELQEAFAPAARAALAASRQVAEQESMEGRLTTFLKAQSGFRSLAPREGNDPDAVLSRAEAATREARLVDAVAELSTLPEVGQQEMTDWVALATERAEAVAAADELAATLATN